MDLLSKNKIRRFFLQKRLDMTANAIEQYSQGMVTRFFEYFPLQNWQGIHLYLPISSRNEPNTFLLIEKLQRQYPHIKIAVPVVLANNILEHCWLTPHTFLTRNKWDILQPENAIWLTKTDWNIINAVIVPLLVCDRLGNRIGYGKGFYDRFLAQLLPDIPRIGFSIAEPIEAILAMELHDIRLSHAVTPTTVWQF